MERTAFTWAILENLRILVVDDDPVQREFSTVYLSTPTVEVITVDSAEAAMAVLDTTTFDAALIDVDMPGMNGIELVHHLRSERRFDALPLMVVTGREDIVSIDAAFDAGATSFMCKPVNWRLLSHQVRFMVRAHRAFMLAEYSGSTASAD